MVREKRRVLNTVPSRDERTSIKRLTRVGGALLLDVSPLARLFRVRVGCGSKDRGRKLRLGLSLNGEPVVEMEMVVTATSGHVHVGNSTHGVGIMIQHPVVTGFASSSVPGG